MDFRTYLELFSGNYHVRDRKFDYPGEFIRHFTIDNEEYEFKAWIEQGKRWMVQFKLWTTPQQDFSKTNMGNSPRVLGAVLHIMRQFIQIVKPTVIEFWGDKDRSTLYERLISRFAASEGYELNLKEKSVYKPTFGVGKAWVPGTWSNSKNQKVLVFPKGKPFILVRKPLP